MDAGSTPNTVGPGISRIRRPRPRPRSSDVASSPLPAVSYERTPGAASLALPGTYRRHEPEKTVLYGIVREHLQTFLAQGRGPDGDGYPRFVEHEFERYLDCGLLCHGFALLRCARCGYERLIAFSCKGKLCPTCLARRSTDTAARLVDQVLPEADYRQWVLTLPWTMWFRLAADRKLLGTMLRVYLQTLFAWQRRRGRNLRIMGGQTGSVTFCQRFGGAINLNPHAHSVLPDGLFVPSPDGRLVFTRLPPPTTAEVEELTLTIAQRCTSRLAATSEADGDGYLDPNLAALVEALFWSRNAPQGRRDLPLPPGPEPAGSEEEGLQGKPLCASVAGFSLHAAQSVPAFDRDGLERLCRYGLRAPFSQERLSRLPDGKVAYKLRRPWPNAHGATHLVLEPLDFLRRLAALVSFPYSHQVRRHGLFSGRSRFRKLLPPPPPPRDPLTLAPAVESVAAGGVVGLSRGADRESSPGSRRRIPWAQLLLRLFHLDALACPKCSSRAERVPMAVLAFLTDPAVVQKILRHLGLATADPAVAKARSTAPPLGFELPDRDPVAEGAPCPDGVGLEEDGEFVRPPP